MELHEKLKGLVGHEVIVTKLEDEQSGVLQGVIQDVGVDYLLMHTKVEDEFSFLDLPKADAELYVRLATVAQVTHIHNCKKCGRDSAANQQRRHETG